MYVSVFSDAQKVARLWCLTPPSLASEYPLVSPRGGTKAPTFTAQGSVKDEGKRRRAKGFHIAAGGPIEGKAVFRTHTPY